MNKTQLTHEEADTLERKIRDAQKSLEEAAQILCPIPGDLAPQVYSRLAQLAGNVGDVVGVCYRLRPWD